MRGLQSRRAAEIPMEIGKAVLNTSTTFMAKKWFRRNGGEFDRWLRAAAGLVALLAGLFLADGWLRLALLAVAVVGLATALTGFCGAYGLFGWDTLRRWPKPLKPAVRWALGAALAIVALVGAVGGGLLNSRSFKQDLAALNGAYKQVLYLSGQDAPETVQAYSDFRARLDEFGRDQLAYRPWVVRDAAGLESRFAQMVQVSRTSADLISQGQNQAAHAQLEQVRPLLREIMQAAGVSELAVALIDFHDVMEQVVAAADAKDLAGVVTAYGPADEKLKAVEALAQDAEIAAIRQALDAVLGAAAQPDPDKLPGLAGKLKSAFVKVYLARG